MAVKIDKTKLLAANGNRKTKALFVEYVYGASDVEPVYTFSREDKEIDGKLYPSLYKLYMECDDITEADFISLYMYDTKQWELISKGGLFKDDIETWREDLRVRKLGEAIGRLEADARSGSQSAPASAKFLAERVYALPKRSGRPVNSKRGVAKPEDTLESVDTDYTRLFGTGRSNVAKQ